MCHLYQFYFSSSQIIVQACELAHGQSIISIEMQLCQKSLQQPVIIWFESVSVLPSRKVVVWFAMLSCSFVMMLSPKLHSWLSMQKTKRWCSFACRSTFLDRVFYGMSYEKGHWGGFVELVFVVLWRGQAQITSYKSVCKAQRQREWVPIMAASWNNAVMSYSTGLQTYFLFSFRNSMCKGYCLKYKQTSPPFRVIACYAGLQHSLVLCCSFWNFSFHLIHG